MQIADLETYLVPTTVSDGQGKFHPGVKHGLEIHYWPNIKCSNEDMAYERARMAINDAREAANSVISQWNVISMT